LSLAENVTYHELLDRLLEFMVRAAIGEAIDKFDWEQEELRRSGLRAIEFARDGKALWWDRAAFENELAEELRDGTLDRFLAHNEVDADFFDRADNELGARLSGKGYKVPTLQGDLKKLYEEIAADLSDRLTAAQEGLVTEVLSR